MPLVMGSANRIKYHIRDMAGNLAVSGTFTLTVTALPRRPLWPPEQWRAAQPHYAPALRGLQTNDILLLSRRERFWNPDLSPSPTERRHMDAGNKLTANGGSGSSATNLTCLWSGYNGSQALRPLPTWVVISAWAHDRHPRGDDLRQSVDVTAGGVESTSDNKRINTRGDHYGR